MSKLQKFWDLIFSKSFAYKFISYALLLIFLVVFKEFLLIIILTFIFGYIFYSISNFLKIKIDLLIDKVSEEKTKIILKKIFSLNFIIIIVYLVLLGTIIVTLSRMVPKLILELKLLPNTFPFLSDYANDILKKLTELRQFNHELWNTIKQIINSSDFGIYVEVYNRLKWFSILFFKVILSLFLSFIFLLDKEKLWKYLLNVKKSNFGFLYKEYKIIFDKVLKSFWVIIKAQATIAFVNTILTAIWLFIIWYINWVGFHYPYLLTLSLIVFFAWFIPVLWTFISSIPIILVWYASFPGIWISFAIEIVILISLIHFIEAYFLNPKIVSKILSLPISMTFVILIFSEQLFWVAGLLLWISLFYFLLWIFSDIDKTLDSKKILK